MFNRLFKWLHSRKRFVVLELADSSVTLSKGLFSHMRRHSDSGKAPKIFVFYIPASKRYGFTLDANFDKPTQLADLQYNERHKCVGFETLNPTVARILCDYGVCDIFHPCRLPVSVRRDCGGRIYYQIEKPQGPLKP